MGDRFTVPAGGRLRWGDGRGKGRGQGEKETRGQGEMGK